MEFKIILYIFSFAFNNDFSKNFEVLLMLTLKVWGKGYLHHETETQNFGEKKSARVRTMVTPL